MDAISSAGAQSQYRSWNTNLLKQLGVDKKNFNGFESDASHRAQVDKESEEYRKSQEQLSNFGSLAKRTMASTNQIFADGTATSTIDSIEAFFKHGNLQNTVGIFSNAGMHDAATSQGASSLLSPELSDTDLAKGAGGLSVSTKQGTTVNVRRDNTNPNTPGGYQLTISRPDGLELAFESNDNMRITDLEDGGLSIFYASTGESHIYDAEGNKKDVLQGEAGALTGTEGDDLLINLSGTEVDGGEGDDTIVNFADNATINGGNGDDTILLGRTVANNTIDAGAGNDHLLGLGAHKGSSIDMGEGDNRVQLGYLGNKSELTTGDGNNDVAVGMVNDSSIHLGNGNNTLQSHALSADVQLGEGNNAIVADTIAGNIVTGDGDNSVLARSMTANINFGNGNNTVKADSIDGSEIDMGDGNNTIEADSFMGVLVAGDGDNTIDIRFAGSVGRGGTTVELGDGNNTVTTDTLFDASLVLGDGKNTVNVRSMSGARATLGNGDNIVSTDSIGGASSLDIGNGNNTVNIRSLHNSKATLGKGHNTVTMESLFGADLITGENTTLMKALKESVLNSRSRSAATQNMFFSV